MLILWIQLHPSGYRNHAREADFPLRDIILLVDLFPVRITKPETQESGLALSRQGRGNEAEVADAMIKAAGAESKSSVKLHVDGYPRKAGHSVK
jgi:hypothetical protein